MKNSIAKSSRTPKVVRKVFKGQRTLGGLAFSSTQAHHFSIISWVLAGTPDNVYIHDSIDNLITAGIPVVDAKVLRGLYIRNKRGKPVECTVNTVQAVPISEMKFIKKIKGIKDANTKDQHKLNY